MNSLSHFLGIFTKLFSSTTQKQCNYGNRYKLLQTEYEDYAMSQTSGIACLRSATLLLLIILLVRQALMVTKNSTTGQHASIIFNFEMLLLQFAGVLLPCCAMTRSWYIQNRRRRQEWL